MESSAEDTASPNQRLDVKEFWTPQTTQSTIEFTHIIKDYASKRESGNKTAEYSDITTDEHGNKWRLIIYVNGNGKASNHHLSLFLQVADANNLPFGWKKAVSYVLTLEHPTDTELSYAKRNPDKTFQMCPKAIDWGWSQFITSDRIQQDGFITNDSLSVKASVTVKSSCVTIDPEDSDLYLKCAVEETDVEAVTLCLEQGANINCKFKDDLYSPLHTACSWIKDKENPDEKNRKAMEVLNLLLEKGADCNAYNKWNETPLLIAANNGHYQAVEALIRKGADASLCSEAGWSALTFAAHKGFHDIVELLIAVKAPVGTQVTEDSSTPLHKACAGTKEGHSESVKLLIGAGADVHALNKWRESPLLTAANHGHTAAVKALLDAGADPGMCTDTGWSPLSIAAYKGHDETVKLLLDEGAPTEEIDTTLSALLQAATKGLGSTVLLLLEYGADHTVTTKKGDTALSILVEQNLIDTAAEMVTKYGASIPRCSRDRKKVQKARLLLKQKMKQLEKDSKNLSTDEDETDEESSPSAKPKKAKSLTAVEKAKAAEEALLMELEAEETKAKQVEAEANNKKAKKRKKKEKERQQRLKEEKERQEKEEQERMERERLEREKAEKDRREKQRLQKQKEDLEALERQKALAAKQREKEERERESTKATPIKATAQDSMRTSQQAVSQVRKKGIQSEPSTPQGSNNRQIHTPKQGVNGAYHVSPLIQRTMSQPDTKKSISSIAQSLSQNDTPPPNQVPSIRLSPRPSTIPGHERSLSRQIELETPAVSIYRRDKMAELIKRCSQSMKGVDESTVRRIIYRWVVRAAHSSTEYVDPFIPSWLDYDNLVTFFQRQLIQENNRKGAAIDMESLKNAGSCIASLCDGYAKDVQKFAEKVEAQIGRNWNDTSIGVTAASDETSPTRDGLTLSLAGRSPVTVGSEVIARLRQRYVGPTERMVSAIYVVRVWYDTFGMLTHDSEMDVQISPANASALASECSVSCELFVDPIHVHGLNAFWGRFEGIDTFFGGRSPLGKESGTLDDLLQGGNSSAVALLPFDSVLSSRYLHCILNTIDQANSVNFPVSFVILIAGESFFDMPNGPTNERDLASLDSRLATFPNAYVSHFDVLGAEKHALVSGSDQSREVILSQNSAILVLQSAAGKSKYSIDSAGFSRLKDSFLRYNRSEDRSILSPISLGPTFAGTPSQALDPNTRLYDPMQTQSVAPIGVGSGSFLSSELIGGDTIGGGFAGPAGNGNGRRRGRLFDLIDDDDEDPAEDPAGLVSGVLSNLELFQGSNTGTDFDIDTFSLLGMGLNGSSRGGKADARSSNRL